MLGGDYIKITIKDIALDTGLSIATISKYLNHKSILEENKLLINRSIQKLHYVPNKTAQGLRTKSSNSICIFIPDIGNHIWGETCNSILEHMKKNNYSVIIRSYSFSSDFMQDIQFLLNRQIDGVVLFTETSFPIDFLALIKENQIPFVCMNQKPDFQTDFISTSYYHTSYHASEYLINKGHQNIGILGINSHSGIECVKGFQDARSRHHLPSSTNQYIKLYSKTDASFHEAFVSLTNPDFCITALVLLDHYTTINVALEFNSLTDSRENQLSIIAFGDDEILSALNPPFTVFANDFQTLGKEAANLLLKRISGDYSSYPASLYYDSIFLERQSVFSNTNN
ncbi:MAG: LacI family DNA-binding transcriptional regulator [Lachnospiraceae bacterium]